MPARSDRGCVSLLIPSIRVRALFAVACCKATRSPARSHLSLDQAPFQQPKLQLLPLLLQPLPLQQHNNKPQRQAVNAVVREEQARVVSIAKKALVAVLQSLKGVAVMMKGRGLAVERTLLCKLLRGRHGGRWGTWCMRV